MNTQVRIPYEPDYITRPGDVLEEYLELKGMTKAELAERCGRPTKTISEIVHGKAAITPETALQFERVLGRPARLWLNLEANYRLQLARLGEAPSLSGGLSWAHRFPLKELVARGAIERGRDDADVVRRLLRFFGVGSVGGWDASFGQMKVAYRRSAAFTASAENVTTWIRLGEIAADGIECSSFDKARFRNALVEARAMTTSSFPEVQQQLVELCASAGVALVLIPELPKTHLSGLARWLTKDKPLIQLSLRYKTADQVWFSLFHEAGHILLHSKKSIFIDEAKGELNELEHEANKFAADQLVSPSALTAFVRAGVYSAVAVKSFARQQGVAPGIVVGRLQHDKLLPFTHLNDLKERLVWASEP